MNGDEQVLNGRVYGAEHDNPTPARFRTGPTPNWSAARWTACC
ncbi:hypothetical protein OOK31_18005 [Streptomyces sp. NBC_00249]|nr:hypothetical protein [Streptomyces sp. NBC_00249]MCX5195766.1 hypothetical protein [Streptomyces sp. NBC_00249]